MEDRDDIGEYINKLETEVSELKDENLDLKNRLNHATDQWNIWCAAYQEIANK